MKTIRLQSATAKLSLAGCALVPAIGARAQHGVENRERPNILFILTDDQRWDAVGYAGGGIIHTPEMDRLAGEGVVFRNAFVTTPISAASRASILTGMYERTHGYTFGRGDLDPAYADQSYPALLGRHGYTTAFFGKLGVNIAGAADMFDVHDFYDRSDWPDRRGYYYKTIDSDTVHLTRYTGHQAVEFIKNRPDERPFCLSLSFSAPHAQDNAPEQYFWDGGSDHLYEDVTIPDPLLAGDSYFEALPREVREGYNRLRWTWRFDTPEKYQHSVKGYFRMISDIDRELGRIRAALADTGLAENTVIIFMGDNGYFLGERQLAGKWLMYDNSLRVPLVVFDPRGTAGEMNGMTLNVDIASTILDAAGVDIPEAYQGVSLLPHTRGATDELRTDFLCEHLWDIREIPASEGLRTDRWKYFRYRHIEVPEELYDLECDPLEEHNLAEEGLHAEKLAEMRRRCDSLIDRYTEAKLHRQ